MDLSSTQASAIGEEAVTACLAGREAEMCSSKTKPDFSYTRDREQGPGKVHSCPWENNSAKEQPWVKCTLEGTPWHHVDNSRMPTRQLCVRLQCSSLQTQACFHLSLTYCICKSTRDIYPYILTAPKCTHIHPHTYTHARTFRQQVPGK